MEARKRLRELVDAKEILVLPGAYDALSARLAEAAGFPCVYMTGYGQSASKLGAPDVGLMTMSEMVERAKDMCAAVSVPVICDGDTGFGNVVNLVRTVREYERAGVAAIQLEDQTTPKKCGHMLGRQVVDAEEMVNKIRALYPASNITPIDYDPSATKVNQENRIKLMLAVAKERLNAPAEAKPLTAEEIAGGAPKVGATV